MLIAAIFLAFCYFVWITVAWNQRKSGRVINAAEAKELATLKHVYQAKPRGEIA